MSDGTCPVCQARLDDDSSCFACLMNADFVGEQDEVRNAPLDWSTFLTRTLTEVDWLSGRIAAQGQLISLVGDGKAGKSIFCQEWAWRAAAGLPFLDDVARRPVRVLYVDHENSHDEIQERMLSFGATADQLAGVAYLSFPTFRPLDTAEGGSDLLAKVEEHRADVVYLDTISRMIKGKENDSDTWLDVYRHTHLRLKRRKVSCVRLDHFGKDKDRGGRGSSAKTQDVDHVWELTGTGSDGQLSLKRTHTRTGHGVDYMAIRRLSRKDGSRWARGETRHVVLTHMEEQPATPWLVATAVARKLDDAGVPSSFGRDKLREECQRLGIKIDTNVLAEVARVRKEPKCLSAEDQDRSPGHLSAEDQDSWGK